MKSKLISVLTGDVVNSRNLSPDIWLRTIKKVLRQNKISSKKWEIFRGDMFQIEVDPLNALALAFKIKASIKEEKDIDVRIGIGIGTKSYTSKKVSESNGAAYINSGECFENLKKRRLAILTPWDKWNEEWNLILQLASLTMDNWAAGTAMVFKEAMMNPDLTQKELANSLKRTQGTISEGLKRAGYEELKQTVDFFNKQLSHKIQEHDSVH